MAAPIFPRLVYNLQCVYIRAPEVNREVGAQSVESREEPLCSQRVRLPLGTMGKMVRCLPGPDSILRHIHGGLPIRLVWLLSFFIMVINL